MAIKSIQKTPRAEGMIHEALTMAVAILVERIQSLPNEDRNDLYDLMLELPKAENEEEVQSIAVTMREILDQAPVRLLSLDSTVDSEGSNGLQRWIDFVGDRIREHRTAAGLTQVQLAEKTGLPQSHISRLENKEHSPSRSTLMKIANALGIPVSTLDPSA